MARTRQLDPNQADSGVGPLELSSAEFRAVPARGGGKGPVVVAVLAVLAVLAGLGASLLFWSQAQQAHGYVVEVTREREVVTQTVTVQGNELKEAKATIERLERENAELLALKQQLSADVERLQGTTTALQEQMKSEIDAGDVAIENAGGRIKVDLIDKVLFDSGDASISARGQAVLKKVAAILATSTADADTSKRAPLIQVAGHTDDSPPTAKIQAQFPTNWELSVARATNVVRFLEESGGLAGARLTATGYGQHAPVATNRNGKGRARNRRIEILLVPALAPERVR